MAWWAAGGAGDADGRDSLVEQGRTRELDQPEIEGLGHPRKVVVPLENLAKLKAGVELPAALEETVEMAAHQVQTLFEPRVGPGLACMCPLVELAEEERIGQRSTADRDRRAACLLEHGRRIGNCPYVAVGHDGNSFHGLDHGADAVPVHSAREPLCARSAVHDHRSRTRLLELAGQDRRGQRFVVPAQPHLDGDRDRNGPYHGAHQLDGTIDLAEQGRAATAANHLPDRAAHVDIHDGCPVRLDPASGLLNLGDDVPVKLDRQRAVLDAGFGQLQRPAPLLDQRPGVDQVGRRQPKTSTAPHRESEGKARVAGQRSQEEARGNRDLTDRERLADNRRNGWVQFLLVFQRNALRGHGAGQRSHCIRAGLDSRCQFLFVPAATSTRKPGCSPRSRGSGSWPRWPRFPSRGLPTSAGGGSLRPRTSSPPRSGWPPAGPEPRRNSPVAIGCGSTPSASSKQPARQWPATRPAASPAPLSSISVRGSAATRWPLRTRQRCWLWIPTTECAVDSPGTPPFTRSRTASDLAGHGPSHSRFRRVPGSTLIPTVEPRGRSERDAWPVTLRAWSPSAVSCDLPQAEPSSSARPATSRRTSAVPSSRSS